MINILIVENDIEYCKKIISKTSKKTDNIRFCAIANNLNEMKMAISFHQIDIIIINFKILNRMNFTHQNIIDVDFYRNSFILILEKKINSKLLLNNSLIFDYILKNNNINKLVNIITDLSKIKNIKKQENLLKNKIQIELQYLGYNLKHIGTKYLIESIYILYLQNNNYNDNLEKNIYPIIAKKYKKSVNNIKCNIINATDNMFFECEETKLMKYVSFYGSAKPGPKTIILAILSKIQNSLETIP